RAARARGSPPWPRRWSGLRRPAPRRGRTAGSRTLLLAREAAAERAVQVDGVGEARLAHLHQSLLGGEQLALGVEHLEVAGHAVVVALLRQRQPRALRLDEALLRGELVVEGGAGHERVGDLAEGLLDGELVVDHRLLLPDLREPQVRAVPTPLEDRLHEARDERPHRRARLE